jgi:butyryl-CoA dehydrogenase
MSYTAPVADIAFTMRAVTDLTADIAAGRYGDLSDDLVMAILDEAGRFASTEMAPLNRLGDTHGVKLSEGRVTLPPGWIELYKAWAAGGWNALSGPEAYGGQGLPTLMNVACLEMWNSALMSFAVGPVLTMGAVEALTHHGSQDLKDRYLAKLVSGEWTATMNLTEPQAGSDLNALRSRAEPAGDGSYRIFGQKIYITYGEHEMTDNIIHLVLARLPDAPPGTRGISLFLVPKILPDGRRNDVLCNGIEHKMGLHASPTCTMIYGDAGGAVGWLIGEENRGLACMFTMMNNARLAVAVQGVAIAERAYQQAHAFARERKQGRAPGWTGEGMSPIVQHPDVKRMLLEMRAKTAAARAICYRTAAAIDHAHTATSAAEARDAHDLASLLTPVAKAFSTDIGIEVASLGIQVHGGMGFVEETGAAQYLRDARIAAIYEGTNGIQAIDLVQRKLPLQGGAVVRRFIDSLRADLTTVRQANASGMGSTIDWVADAVDALDRSTTWMLDAVTHRPADALAGATPYLRLFALATGGTALTRKALAASRAVAAGDGDPGHGLRIATARFFAANLATAASGLAASITEGADSVATAFSSEDAA